MTKKRRQEVLRKLHAMHVPDSEDGPIMKVLIEEEANGIELTDDMIIEVAIAAIGKEQDRKTRERLGEDCEKARP
jgi:hypothetical protein